MAIDFPSSPTTNQVYTSNTKAWIYNGYGWKSYQGIGTIATSAVANTTATAGQTLFTTPTYVQGQNQLRVFQNGIRKNNVTDYTETTTTSVTLTSGAALNDLLVFEVNNYTGTPLLVNTPTIIDDNTTNAIRYPLFGSSTSAGLSVVNTGSTKLQFNPSTGTLTTINLSANNDVVAGLQDGVPLGGATNPIISAIGNTNNYIQSYIINYSNTAQSSSDFVAYPNNGTDSAGWIDMGITSNAFSQAAYSVTGRNEGYVFMSAPAGSGTSGNLVISTDSTGLYNSIEFYTGGFSTGKTPKVKITTQTTSTSNVTGTLLVTGGVGISGPLNVGGVAGIGVPSTSGTSVLLGRQDAVTEGGQIGFASANNNSQTWYIDSFGSTTTPSLRFVDGTNLRATFDSFGYFTGNVNGLSPGIYPAQQYFRLNSTVVGSNATGAQNMLGVGVTLVGGTVYEFEYVYALSKSAGVTSHTISLLFGGTATVNNIAYDIQRYSSGTAFVDFAATSLHYFIQTAASTAITGAITTAARFEVAVIKGTVSINAGGTFIPQYALSAAPGGAYTTAIGSYMKIWPLGASGTNTSIGSWA